MRAVLRWSGPAFCRFLPRSTGLIDWFGNGATLALPGSWGSSFCCPWRLRSTIRSRSGTHSIVAQTARMPCAWSSTPSPTTNIPTTRRHTCTTLQHLYREPCCSPRRSMRSDISHGRISPGAPSSLSSRCVSSGIERLRCSSFRFFSCARLQTWPTLPRVETISPISSTSRSPSSCSQIRWMARSPL
jgi:hypothetical protein